MHVYCYNGFQNILNEKKFGFLCVIMIDKNIRKIYYNGVDVIYLYQNVSEIWNIGKTRFVVIFSYIYSEFH